jgi:hypothetical protein
MFGRHFLRMTAQCYLTVARSSLLALSTYLITYESSVWRCTWDVEQQLQKRKLCIALNLATNRADRVDDVPDVGDSVAAGALRVACRAAAHMLARSNQRGASGPVDRAVDPAAVDAALVRCVHDGVALEVEHATPRQSGCASTG